VSHIYKEMRCKESHEYAFAGSVAGSSGGNHHVEVEVDGHNRILHKDCYQKLFPEEAKRAKKSNNGGLHHP